MSVERLFYRSFAVAKYIILSSKIGMNAEISRAWRLLEASN